MQSAQALYLKSIEDLIQFSELDKAIELLIKLDNEAQAGIGRDVVLISAQLRDLNQTVQNGLVSPLDAAYKQEKNRIRYVLTELMKDIPRKIDLYAQVRNLDTYQFNISDKLVSLEKIIGSKDNLLTIGWLEKALIASRAVCRVVRADQEMGTGFLTQDGYLITNHHVLENAEEAQAATIEFNYEVGASGNVKPSSQYKLDVSDFATSPVAEFDFTRVKVIDNSDKPLKEWGFLEIDANALPVTGDAVTIIQHASGGDKRIALRANEVVAQKDQFLYYTTDTEPGSSGSPVFNRDWKVVALHHAAKKIDGRDANEGILFRNIQAFLGKK